MMMALSYQKLNQKYWKKFPRERMAERKRHMLALSKPCILIEIHVKNLPPVTSVLQSLGRNTLGMDGIHAVSSSHIGTSPNIQILGSSDRCWVD